MRIEIGDMRLISLKEYEDTSTQKPDDLFYLQV